MQSEADAVYVGHAKYPRLKGCCRSPTSTWRKFASAVGIGERWGSLPLPMLERAQGGAVLGRAGQTPPPPSRRVAGTVAV